MGACFQHALFLTGIKGEWLAELCLFKEDFSG